MSALNSNGTPPPHIPENGESVFFQPNESSGSEEQPEVKIYLVNHAKSDPNYYKRLGFYCALDTVQNPRVKFLELLAEQKDFIRDRRSGVEQYYFAKEDRYNQRIKETQNKISDEKVKMLGHIAELGDAISEVEQYEQEVREQEHELSDSMVVLGQRKENLISDAIMAVRRHLEDLIESYHKVYDERYKINVRTFDDNRAALEIKVEKFKQLRDVAEDQWNRIIKIMHGLHLDGVNPFLVRWLFYLGVAIATVCGAYFFSIFALSKGLNDENVTFFFLSGLQSFIQNLFLPGIAIGWQFAILFTGLAAIIFLITAVAYLCWKLLGKFEPADVVSPSNTEHQFSFESGEETKLSIEINTRSSNFYQFWLQVIPIIVIVGILLFIIFLGLQNSPGSGVEILKRLDISLTGATIGALLTLMIAGLSYLYIIKVVEPRADRTTGKGNIYLVNIELVITGLMFIITTFSLFALKAGENHQLILLEYVALVLSNGFLLGYALRMKGLFSTLGFLERKILMLSNAIRDNLRPRPLNFTSKEDNNFRKEYFRLQKELFHLLLLKTQLGNTALGGANANNTRRGKKNKKQGRGWWSISFKKSPEGSSPADERMQAPDILTEWEARLYPENHAIIREITENLKRARARLKEAGDRVTMLKEERTPYCEVLKDNIRRLEDSLDGTKREREKILFNKSREFTALHMLSDTIQADLREGFNLGTWFRSEVGPGDPPDGYTGNANVEIVNNIVLPPKPGQPGLAQNPLNEQLNFSEKQ